MSGQVWLLYECFILMATMTAITREFQWLRKDTDMSVYPQWQFLH